jgi:hypothetical protein
MLAKLIAPGIEGYLAAAGCSPRGDEPTKGDCRHGILPTEGICIVGIFK